MTTTEVAARFHELAQQGNWNQIQNELYSEVAESIEPPHAPGLASVKGLDLIRDKAITWNNMIETTHGGYSHPPQVAGNFFSVIMGMDLTLKNQERMKMDEIAVYEVKDGKIVREQFFF